MRSIFFAVIILIITAGVNMAQVTADDFKVIDYSTTIEDGDPLEKNLLLKGDKNIIAQVTLRDDKSMGVHTEENAFWVLATAGSGELILGEKKKVIELRPGILVMVKPGIPHDVAAKPDLSILVIKFVGDKNNEKHEH